jgi:plasmid replication initiation protein
MDKQRVCKSNALIEASYRLTIGEQRLILSCIAQVRPQEPLTDEHMYRVTVQDIAQLTESGTTTTVYRDVKEAAGRFFERRVMIYGEPNGKGKRPVLVTRWVQTVAYIEDAGRVELRFSKDIIPYLTQLTEQFTQYALSDVAKMTSSYAIRLYELLVQWRGEGKREVALEWLRNALQLAGKYSSIKDFKKWVIAPAVAQINAHSPLNVSVTQRKAGRVVTHLVFAFTEKAPAPDKPTPAPVIYGVPMSLIESDARPGETYSQAAARLAKSVADRETINQSIARKP